MFPDGLGGILAPAAPPTFDSAAARAASSVAVSGPGLAAFDVATDRWDPALVHTAADRFVIPIVARVHAWASMRVPGAGGAGITFMRTRLGVSGVGVAEHLADREQTAEVELVAVGTVVLAINDYLQLLAGCDAASAPMSTVPAAPDQRAPYLMAERSSFVGTQLRANAAQTLSASTVTELALQTSVFDDGSWGNTGTGRIVVPDTGRYLFTGRNQWGATSDTGSVFTGIYRGASPQWLEVDAIVDSSGVAFGQTLLGVLDLTAGDSIGIRGWQGTPGNLATVVANGLGPQLTIERDTATGTCAANNGATAVNSNTLTALGLNVERWDDGGWHDNAVNNSRITVPSTRRYRVIGHNRWAANGTGVRGCYVRKNGTDYVLGTARKPDPFSSTDQSVSGLVDCTAGDYLELVVYQESGGALNTDGAAYNYAVCLQVEEAP